MARIREYQLDENISINDYLLGNDGDNGAVVTKRFSISNLRDFFADESSDANITYKVPKGWTAAVVSEGEGTDIHRATLRLIQNPADTANLDFSLTSINADNIKLNLAGTTGQVTLDFVNFRESYDLDTFPTGTRVTITDSSLDGTSFNGSVMGTVSTLKRFNIDNEEVANGVRDFVYDENDDYVYQLQVELDTPVSLSIQNVDAVSFDMTPISYGTEFAGDLSVLGGTSATGSSTIGGNLNVTGSSQLGDRVDIGDPVTHAADVHIHGELHFDEETDGIVFGPIAPDASITRIRVNQAGNVFVNGEPANDVPSWNFSSGINVNIASMLAVSGFSNNGALNQTGTVTISSTSGTTDGTLTVAETISAGGTISGVDVNGDAANLLRITANNSGDFTTTRTEELTSIQVGNGNFTLPEFSAGVAEALPGFNETFGSNPNAFTTGRWFAGLEQSAGAIFEAEITAAGGATNIPIPAGVTTVDIGNDGDTNVVRFENIRTQFQARDNDQERLFFVESTYSDAFPASGTVIEDGTTNLYEVIAYNGVDNVLTFGLLGEGTINIATSTLNISSEDVILSGIDDEAYTPETHDFITVRKVNPDIDTLTRSSLNITAAANGARITEEDGVALPTSVGITSLEFTKTASPLIQDENGVRRSTGDVTVDVSGRYFILGEITQPADISVNFPARVTNELQAFDLVVLRPTNNGDDQFVTLPTGQLGDSIKIVNTSTINDDGSAGATTGQWSINSAIGQSIMGIAESEVDSDLDLDDPTASFELVYSGGNMGWTIIGIN